MPAPLSSRSVRLLGAATLALALALAISLAPSAARAEGLSPYASDAHTVLLYHLDEAAGTPAAANATGSFPAIGTASGTPTSVFNGSGGFTGFGGTARTTPATGLGVDVDGDGLWSFDSSSVSHDRFAFSRLIGPGGVGAFTLEALIKVASITPGGTLHQHIWGADGLAQRAFQFRINSNGVLNWDPLPGGTAVTFDLTTLTGAHAFAPNVWFHVAITYQNSTGTNPVTKLYWTRVDSGAAIANLVATDTTLPADLSALSAALVLGNEGRGPATGEGLDGLIDEARVSDIARAADDFIFSYDDDHDGLPDAWEIQYFGDLSANSADDPDHDELTNLQEFALGSNPKLPTDPLDLDGDGLPDAWELQHFGSITLRNASDDPDGDTLTNLQEFLNGSDPQLYNNPDDIDNDSLSDAWERQYFSSLAQSAVGDFDHDGFTNAQEFIARSNPAAATSVPGDSDTDGLSDAWEIANFGALAATSAADPDQDGFGNVAEQSAGTDPNDPASHPGAASDPAQPTGLLVNLLGRPELTTVPDTRPTFTWIFHPVAVNETQTAYELIVSSTRALATAGTGDVWSSGKVISADSVNIPLGGPALTRGSTYVWRVRTWGAGPSPSAWSRGQAFTIEPTVPPAGARSISKSSSNIWSGRYQPAFNTTVPPAAVISKGSGNYFIDFGRAGFGYLSLRLNGAFSGQTLTVRLGESAIGNSVNTVPGATIRYASQTVALADGDVTYEVHKASTTTGINIAWSGGVMPFRYVELLDCPATLTAADIRQHLLHIPFDDEAARFASSDPTLDAVWALSSHSIKVTTFCGVYIDGDRERKPYEADAYINQLCHYGMDREFSLARYSYEYLLDNHTWPTEWRFHFPLMAWADYLHTGDAKALAANYTALKAYLRTDRERPADKLFQGWPNNGTAEPSDLVDWPSTERDGYVQTSYGSVTNAFHYRALRLMARIATVLGNTADADAYTATADTLQTAFNTVFWNSAAGLYQDGETSTHLSAHGNFFPLAHGLVPADRVPAVVAYLKTRRMAPSVYGAQYLLEALFTAGEDDYAIGLLADHDPAYKRSWWNMIREGSTITLEAWGVDAKSNLDWNHAWGAAPANLIPRFILGVQPLTPGFARAEIRPCLGTGSPTAGLTHVAGVVPTIRGPVAVTADNSPTSFALRLTIPGNLDARVLIPTKGHANPVLIVDGRIVAAPVEAGRLVVEHVLAGEHTIRLAADLAAAQAALHADWKTARFGADAANPAIAGDTMDPDGDGQTNLQEYLANTGPLDPADRFAATLAAAPTGPGIVIRFPAKTDRRYTLERTPDLTAGSWTPRQNAAPLDAEAPFEFTDPAPPTPKAFYRVRAELP